MTYTLVDSFYSPYFFYIFFIQIIPILMVVYYPLNKRFPIDYPVKRILTLVLPNILFCYICSVILYQIYHCIMVYYIIVLFFCFFQYLAFQLNWTKKKTPHITIYFSITLLINVVLLNSMNYIRLLTYSLFNNNFGIYYLIELIPILFIFIVLAAYNLIDTFIQTSLLKKKITFIFFISYVWIAFLTIFPQFLSVYSFTEKARVSIFENFIFKNFFITLFPKMEIVYLNQSIPLYQLTVLFFGLGLIAFFVNTFGLIALKKRQAHAESIRRERQLREHISVTENIIHQVQKYQHDYRNVLLTLNNYIETSEDVSDEFRNYFQQVLDDFELSSSPITVPKLEKIKIKEIYSLILGKYQYAKLKKIDIKIEVPTNIDFDYFNTLHYCKILGILIDNAINASLLCEKPKANISLISDDNKTVFIIENNTISQNVLVDIRNSANKIRKNGHGYGMVTVQMIVNDYPNISLESSQTNQDFKQTLTIFDHSKKP